MTKDLPRETSPEGKEYILEISVGGQTQISIKPTLLPFENTIQRLEEGLARYQKDTSDDQIRDGLIQRFEFTYELSHKVLKRYLIYTSANPEQYDEMTFQDQIRSANQQGLLKGSWPEWKTYRQMRGTTSHTYNEELAIAVVEIIPKFIAEVKYLHKSLKERLE